MSAALALDGVSITYGSAEIVSAVSTEVEPGEWVGLIGPNGAGKTTLLRAIAGLVSFRGSILVDGRPVTGTSRRELARQIALVAQSPQTPSALTVAEYVLLGRTPYIGHLGSESESDRAAAAAALDKLGLDAFAGRALGSLSGGERQRVVVARALAQDAPVLLLDEPTSALDLGRQQQALELVDALRREHGLTVVSAMHDLSLAGQFSDRLVLLDSGRVVAQGPPGEVLSAETIARLYAAEVRIVEADGAVFVLPQRWRQP